MLALLLLYASLAARTVYCFPIDPRRLLSQFSDSLINTRDASTATNFDQRTTYVIVRSCLVTIVACVWGAVHPNVPGPWDAGWTILKRRVTTTLCTLIAPELMVAWALRQHFAARRITKKYNKAFVPPAHLDDPYRLGIVHEWLVSAKTAIHEWFTKLPENTAVRRKPWLTPVSNREPWTITHGFFVQMGGFMLYEGEYPKKVLDFDSMCYLIWRGQIAPTVTETELKDRSKGNALSKSAIMMQTSWFVIQCLARLASQLPLSGLEVITLAFAVMNVIVYGLWWSKPQEVGAAIPVHLQWSDTIGSEHDMENSTPSVSNPQETSETGPTPRQELSDPHAINATQPPSEAMEYTRTQETLAEIAPPGESFEMHVRGLPDLQTLPYGEGRTASSTSSTLRTTIPLMILWMLIKSFLRKMFNVLPYLLFHLHRMFMDYEIPHGAMNVPNFYSDDIRDDPSLPIALVCTACLIGSLFGAIHFFSWSSVFPSHAAQIIWRVSVLTTTAGPLAFLLLILCMSYNETINKVSKFVRHFVGFLVLLIPVLCILSRFALLTVALVSLKALPQDIFLQVRWTSFIPHI